MKTKFTLNGEHVVPLDHIKVLFYEQSSDGKTFMIDQDEYKTATVSLTKLIQRLGVDLEKDVTIELGKKS